ncbi:DMT family transporter [Nitratidesulfovibrio sp.]|uniref:DMT family transporter n=1 Tax=Nitratidesulfovibrio sp. TaxID=2802297 RepID=UPI0033425921
MHASPRSGGPGNGGTRGVLLALAATVIWSGNFIVARALADSMPPVSVSFARWLVATCVLLPFGLGPLRREWPVVRAHLVYFCVTGFVGVSVFNTFIYVAGRTTAALNMALIATSSPIFIILFSRVFLGEAVTLRRLAGLATAVTGIVVLVTRGELARLSTLTFTSGDLWMVAASMLFAGYSVLVRKRPAGVGQTTFLMATFIPGLLGILPMLAWELSTGPMPVFTPQAVAGVLYIGLGASLVAYRCWNLAIAAIGPSRAALIYYSLPAFSGLEALLLLGEPVTPAHFTSGALILGGILIATR